MQQRVSTLHSEEDFLPKSRERGQFDLFLNFQSRLRPEATKEPLKLSLSSVGIPQVVSHKLA